MSFYGKGILSRLNPDSGISNPKNPGHIVFDNTIGAWMDNFEETDYLKQLFLITATNTYIDVHGSQKGVYRLKDETDEEYRLRIINEKSLKFNLHDLKNLGVDLWCYVNSINNNLTSKNVYLHNKYYAHATDEVITKINTKFLIGDTITWF